MRRFRNSLSTSVVALLFVGGLIAVLAGIMYLQMIGAFYDPEEGFERMIAYPVPAAVTDLQGAHRDSMQGYSAWLRFRAASLAAAGIASPPYVDRKCPDILALFHLPTDAQKSRFSPEWVVPASPTACMSTELPKGSSYALYDNGQVFFSSTVD